MHTVQVIEKDVNRGWFSEGGKTVIHVSVEEAGSVKYATVSWFLA